MTNSTYLTKVTNNLIAHQGWEMNYVSHLGFGFGSAVREAFNSLHAVWESLRTNEQSKQKFTKNTIAKQLRSLEQPDHWPGIFDLKSLNGTNGFSVYGIAKQNLLGASVSAVGDFNGDGRVDLILGSPVGDNMEIEDAGRAFVLYGQEAAWPKIFNLVYLNGTNGFKILGLPRRYHLGNSVSGAGDLNGDGVADIVLGAYEASTSPQGYFAGTAFVLFGQTNFSTQMVDVTSLNGLNGFKIEGISAYGHLGYSVSKAGDLNGDGIADLVLGAPVLRYAEKPAVYVLFGHTGNWPAVFNLTSLNGSNGFIIESYDENSNDCLGYSVSSARDFNADGIDDLIIGAPSSQRGTVYVLFGHTGNWPAVVNITRLTGANGFMVDGLQDHDQLGGSVSTAGDFNGDTIADLVIGAPMSRGTGLSKAGEVYVIFGQKSSMPPIFNLSSLNGLNGFKVSGNYWGGSLGFAVSTAGDLNDDGIADLLLGARGDWTDPGTAYVLFGQKKPMPAQLKLNSLNGTNGFIVSSISSYDYLGSSVSAAGDFNGDGYDDILLGADNAGVKGTGAVFSIFGRKSSISLSPQPMVNPNAPSTTPIIHSSAISPSPQPMVNPNAPSSIDNRSNAQDIFWPTLVVSFSVGFVSVLSVGGIVYYVKRRYFAENDEDPNSSKARLIEPIDVYEPLPNFQELSEVKSDV
jgi:hypothetical protein